MLKKLTARRSLSALSALVVFGLAAMAAWAVTAPATGDPGYEVYDFMINSVASGPIGLVAGVLAIGFGAYNIIGRSQFALGVPALFGGFILLKLETIVTSLAGALM